MPSERVLLVDDEPSVRDVCQRWLQRVGYETAVVAGGREAIAAFGCGAYDALIVDIRMPEVDGLAACQAIRELDADVALIVMTGYGTMDYAIKALELGVTEFVQKPFRPSQLVAALERALEKRRLRRENARLTALVPLFELSRAFMGSVDLAAIPQQVVRIARAETQADAALLRLLRDADTLIIHAAEGLPPDRLHATHLKVDEGVAGLAMQERRTICLQGETLDDANNWGLEQAPGALSVIVAPLIQNDRVLGVLSVFREGADRPFTRADVELVSVLATQAAIAIENARLFGELQGAYDRLSELDRLKGAFIAIASHELRQPLAVLLAYAELLEEEATGPMREHLEHVLESAMQLKSVIDEMMSLRRIDTGQAEVAIQDVDLTRVVGQVLTDLRPLAERKSIELGAQLPDDLPPARADYQVIRLILGNLVSNAVKFTPHGGSVRVWAAEENGHIVLAVTDTGIGIPKDELERIFMRFYQVEESLRRQHGGLGLGLAVAREMAELIDAQVTVESEPGRGATFRVTLRKGGQTTR
ncbi:MAG: response regulator [Chloroflexi bacterium]|nr:response regulator [Chloroflexota bacterium]